MVLQSDKLVPKVEKRQQGLEVKFLLKNGLSI